MEASETCLRKIKTYFWDLGKRNKIIGGIGREYQNPPFLPRSRKARFWGAIVGTNYLRVLLRLYGMGLRPNDQIRGHWQARGWPAKVITGMTLKEELKVFMVIPNLSEVKSHLGTFVRGGLKHSYPPGYSFKGTLWRGVEYWILDEGGG